MPNPILQAMNQRKNNGNMGNIMNVIQMAKGNPDAAYDMMMKTNPKFAEFVKMNQGKSPEQIAQENGISLNSITQFLK